MSWWTRFDRAEVAADFARIAACGLDSVRVFLTWEDFQPVANRVDRAALARLGVVADLAAEFGLALMPTLFTGHMSGVNWVPAWALGADGGTDRFRVVSQGRVANGALRNWYTDAGVEDAQRLLAAEAVASLAGHRALLAWDLGNGNSNCVTPPTQAAGRRWLSRVTAAGRSADADALVTVGLHMEDLEEDRQLGPGDVSACCDLLSMHGYPIYARWADGPTDSRLLSWRTKRPPTPGRRWRVFVAQAVSARCSGATRITIRRCGGLRRSISLRTSSRSGSGGPTAHQRRRPQSSPHSPEPSVARPTTPTRGSTSSDAISRATRGCICRASTAGIERPHVDDPISLGCRAVAV